MDASFSIGWLRLGACDSTSLCRRRRVGKRATAPRRDPRGVTFRLSLGKRSTPCLCARGDGRQCERDNQIIRPVLPLCGAAPGRRTWTAAIPERARGRGRDRLVSGFFIPRMLARAAQQSQSRLEAVDSNGLIPLADHGRAFPTARGYRAFVQRSLRTHLQNFPESDPLSQLARHDGADVPWRSCLAGRRRA